VLDNQARGMEKLLQDELIKTLQSDETTKDFLYLRIKEIFEELYNNDKEVEIDKLNILYAYTKNELLVL